MDPDEEMAKTPCLVDSKAKTDCAASASKESTYEMVILDNGLVSMELTPEYLVPVVKRNSLESPLLRLPAELREKIWKYAMGGQKVEFRKVKPVGENLTFAEMFEHPQFRPYTREPSVFHLPEVCRQIYVETATLGYALNIFLVTDVVVCSAKTSRSWITQLRPATHHAIIDLEVDYLVFQTLLDSWPYVKLELGASFPGLRRVHCSQAVVDRLGKYYDGWMIMDVFYQPIPSNYWESWTKNDCEKWIKEHVQYDTDKNLPVIFY